MKIHVQLKISYLSTIVLFMLGWPLKYIIIFNKNVPLKRMFHRFLLVEDFHENCLNVPVFNMLDAIDQID